MNIVELIPQVFYDAIARFVAGLTMLATWLLVWWPETEEIRAGLVAAAGMSAFYTAAGVTVTAYVVALLVEGARHTPTMLGIVDPLKRLDRLLENRRKVSTRKRRAKKAAEAAKGAKQITDPVLKAEAEDAAEALHAKASKEVLDLAPGIWASSWMAYAQQFGVPMRVPGEVPSEPTQALAIDAIRMSHASVGARIVKIRAEVALCETLVAGWLLTAGVVAGFHGLAALGTAGLDTSRLLLSFGALVTLATGARARKWGLDDRHLRSLFNHWLLLVQPGLFRPKPLSGQAADSSAS